MFCSECEKKCMAFSVAFVHRPQTWPENVCFGLVQQCRVSKQWPPANLCFRYQNKHIKQGIKKVSRKKNEKKTKNLQLTDHDWFLFFYLQRRAGTVSLKSFLLCSLFCKMKNCEIIQFLHALIKIYCASSQSIGRDSFVKLMRHAGGKLNEQKAHALFYALDVANLGYISFETFVKYTEQKPHYKFLYHKSEHIRRQKLAAPVSRN